MKFYHDNSVIQHGANTKDLDIDFQKPIVVGKFVDTEKPTFLDMVNEGLSTMLGDKYETYEGVKCPI